MSALHYQLLRVAQLSTCSSVFSCNKVCWCFLVVVSHAAPTPTSRTIPRHRRHQDACPCLCYDTCGLLQWRSRRVTDSGSMTAASHLCCMLTFQSVFSWSWPSQCTAAYRTTLRFIWWTAVVESQILSVGAIYDPRVNTIWLYHVTGSVPLVVGPSLLLARQLGTLYQTACMTRY